MLFLVLLEFTFVHLLHISVQFTLLEDLGKQTLLVLMPSERSHHMLFPSEEGFEVLQMIRMRNG